MGAGFQGKCPQDGGSGVHLPAAAVWVFRLRDRQREAHRGRTGRDSTSVPGRVGVGFSYAQGGLEVVRQMVKVGDGTSRGVSCS